MGQKLRGAISGRRMESGTIAAVGAWFYALDTDRFLYLMRNDIRNPGSWGLPGGKVETGETLLTALERECQEELGHWPQSVKLVPLEQFTSADERFQYHTFLSIITHEFQPRLNHEHLGYAWLDRETWPRPMHPGLWNTINLESIRAKIGLVLDTIRCRNN